MRRITQEARWRQHVMEYLKKHGNVTATARRYHISRKTVHKWKKRWDGTLESLCDQSRRPHKLREGHNEYWIRVIKRLCKKHHWKDTVFLLRYFFIIILMFIMVIPSSDNLSKQQILALVQDNHEYLQECVDAKDYEKAEEISGIKSVHSSSWSEDSYVEFYCGGAGIVPSSSYYGFYFSPGDVPLAVDVTQTKKLRPDGNGFAWQEKWERSDGDNSYYTERIMECWYYYESHF